MLKHFGQYCLCGGRIFFCGLRALLASGFPQFLLVCSQHSQHVSRAILAHLRCQSLVVFCFLTFLLFFALRASWCDCEVTFGADNYVGQCTTCQLKLGLQAAPASGQCILFHPHDRRFTTPRSDDIVKYLLIDAIPLL